MNAYPSKLVERAVEQLSTLPGVGRKTALRLALHLLSRPTIDTHTFADALVEMRDGIVYCRQCHNISDTEECEICTHPHRDKSTICVVENVQNVMAIEATGQYRGVYHVLGGVISPMDGVGPGDLHIQSLLERVATGEVKEVIFALNPTMEGDTTNFYISRKLQHLPSDEHPVQMSVLARGIGVGDDLEYADEVTLGRSLIDRVALKQ